jgi:KUP system potassium uptake protein
MNHSHQGISKITTGGLLITLGIVFGDIGTSPLYVMKAITSNAELVDHNFILGALSCIIWTLTLQTTVKYVIITLRADNKGEGGIFSLFALLRKYHWWAYILAIAGGSALLADGVITPAITVVSSVEGLELLYPHIKIVPIAILIITGLFFMQQFGTKFLGSSFGPIMLIWFSMLGIFGVIHISDYPNVLLAFNPAYAVKMLASYPNSFFILGAVFLCTTGAEALYSDLGHCGINNIRISWVFVKLTLILNYLGQGAFILSNSHYIGNPFFGLMPVCFIPIGVFIATAAAIIASQSIISGSFTLISEAISLNFWPKVKRVYPTTIKGQVYIPSINWFLLLACIFVVLFFKESSNMEAAYGLSITFTMLMTTLLMGLFLRTRKTKLPIIVSFLGLFLIIEGSFLLANLQKFLHGGWFTMLIASVFVFIMYSWYRGRKIKNSFISFVKIKEYLPVLTDLSVDNNVPKYASNLVYITRANSTDDIESKIIYSILNKQPKRADKYWFIHPDIVDEPFHMEYKIREYVPDKVYKIDFIMGFKIQPKINYYFQEALKTMKDQGEIDLMSSYPSLRKYSIPADFHYINLRRIPTYDNDFNFHEKFIMLFHNIMQKISLTDVKSYELDITNTTEEKAPLVFKRTAPLTKSQKDHYYSGPVLKQSKKINL